MEEMELLKKDWNKDSESFKTYSEKDLFAMIKGRSVSVAKTLVMIGVIEILLWIVLLYFDKLSYEAFFGWQTHTRLIVFAIFIVAIIFFYLKMKNEKSTKELMKDIIILRKLIFGYIIVLLVFLLAFNVLDIQHSASDVIRGLVDGYNEGNNISGDKPKTVEDVEPVVGYIIFFVSLVAALYFLSKIYKWVYGPLLQKLKANYAELTKLEEIAE